ncbi:MAG TPA: hypothetical protein VL173_04460 [Vicinamibacterales bacterium]|jgi:hypothetical protein|nr:hypothetical protein [Vicinamibacterales bacterium]
MTTRRVIFTVIALAAIVLCGSMWTAAVPAHAAALGSRHSAAISDLSDLPEDPSDGDATDDLTITPQFDVYGNEVDDAVGGYRIDPRGDEYEEHSPDTEIVRLGPPIG